MHTEKQRIFDQYAESMGFDDWDHLVNDFECNLMTIDEFYTFMFEACDLVQQEQQKRIAENAKTVTNVSIFNPRQVVDKNTIINTGNTIK